MDIIPPEHTDLANKVGLIVAVLLSIGIGYTVITEISNVMDNKRYENRRIEIKSIDPIGKGQLIEAGTSEITWDLYYEDTLPGYVSEDTWVRATWDTENDRIHQFNGVANRPELFEHFGGKFTAMITAVALSGMAIAIIYILRFEDQ